jgi:hypothetical protein
MSTKPQFVIRTGKVAAGGEISDSGNGDNGLKVFNSRPTSIPHRSGFS